MARALRMPQPGQMTEECTILQWYKAAGDTVEKGDALYEIETDKSNMDVEAFDTGTLLAILAAEGATVPVDSVVAWIGEAGETVPDRDDASTGAIGATLPAPSPASPVGDDRERVDGAPGRIKTTTSAHPIGAAETGSAPPEAGSKAPEPARKRPSMSPRASRVAIELAVDPSTLEGSGPGGRIVERDVRAAADRARTPTTEPAMAASVGRPAAPPLEPAPPAPATHQGFPERMSRLRQVIARRLAEQAGVPTFTVSGSVDMTDVIDVRQRLRDEGSDITLTDIVHAATIRALGEFSLVNAVTDGTTLWRRDRVHLGIAVSVPDGLLVPVLRDTDTLGLAELSRRTRDVVARAREGRLGPDELSGSTFTVSNMGMFDVDEFSAIINPGESAILAVSSIRPAVVAADHGIVTRRLMRTTLTADHRLIDGELAARFLGEVRRRLEDAELTRTLLDA